VIWHWPTLRVTLRAASVAGRYCSQNEKRAPSLLSEEARIMSRKL